MANIRQIYRSPGKTASGKTASPVRQPVVKPAWGAPLCVGGVWLLVLLASIVLLARYDYLLPTYEDWVYIPYALGKEPISFKFLWQQEAEHRYFLVKAAFLGALRLSGGDFRVPIFLCILAYGGLSWALLKVAKRLRGYTSYTDIFFPLAFLPFMFGDFGYAWRWYAYRIPPLILGLLFVIMMPRISRLSLGWAALAALCLVALALSSAAGLLYLPFAIVLLGYCAYLSWSSPGRRGKWVGSVIMTGIVAALLVSVLYFRGYDWNTASGYAPRTAKVWDILRYALVVFTGSFGHDYLESAWPMSGWVVGLSVAASAGFLIRLAWRQPGPNRARALGILCFFGICGLAALGLGRGRAAFDYWGGYYGLFVLPLPWCVYFTWGIWRSKRWSAISQAALVLGMGAIDYWYVVPTVLLNTNAQVAAQETVEQDLRIGTPPYLLCARYRPLLIWGPLDAATDKLRMLRDAGVGFYKYLQDDPPLQEVSLPLEPAESNNVGLDDGRVRSTGDNAYLTLALPKPMLVAYIRVETGAESPSGPLGIAWKKSEDADFPAGPQFSEPVDSPFKLAIGETIDRIRIYPSALAITRVSIFVPE